MNGQERDDFFIAGGTLRADASSYIKRSADAELYNHVMAGEFCYVLTPRQMGKSSLMVSTALQLQINGFAAAKIDLTKIGTTDIGRWYLGILTQIERELKLGTNPGKWWKDNEQLSPVQEFIYFLREVLLTKTNKKIAIFIDEIDSTLKYDFRDDFFAGIRSIYNSRAEDPEYNRLTFVLLGVAAPTDLIKDRTRTPFNIGQEISLTNFSREEVSIFESGLEKTFPGQSAVILDRIHSWSNGHPYLTQKLCMAIADEQKTFDEEEIDNFVKQAFLSQQAYRETNLQFVRDMLVKNAQKRQLVSLYARIRKGGQVPEDKKSSLQNQLRLSGLVRSQDGFLVVNNKIYQEAFSLEWIKENTEINWPPIIATVTTIVALFFAGISTYNSIILPAQFAGADNCFYNPNNSPEEKLSCLATMFRKDPFFGIGDNDDRAREKFFSLTSWEDQRSIFQANNMRSQDLVEVTRGLYYALADINQTGENTRLLEIMKESLARVNRTPEIDQLDQELDAWLSARKSLERGDNATALTSYNQAIDINSENPSTLFERGMLQVKRSDFTGALQSFDEAIRVSKKSSPTGQPTGTPLVTINPPTPNLPTATLTNSVVPPVEPPAFSTPQTVATPSILISPQPPLNVPSITSEFYTHTKRVIVIRNVIDNNEELLSSFNISSTGEYINLRNTPEIASLVSTVTMNALNLSVQIQNANLTFNTVGQPINYVYVVTNNGATALQGPVTLADNKVTPVNCPEVKTFGNLNNNLDTGESLSCTGTYAITQADLNAGLVTNVATATVGGVTSNPVSTTLLMTQVNRITIPPGSTSTVISSSVNPRSIVRYVLSAAQGQTLSVKVTATVNEVGLAIYSPANAVLKPMDATLTWTGTIPANGDHFIDVASLTGSNIKSYTLEVSLTTPAPPTVTFQPTMNLQLDIPVEIVSIVGAGTLNAEWVVVRNAGTAPLSFAGWRLKDSNGNVFIFPNLTLNGGGTVQIHSTSGTNTVIDLYWEETKPIWQSGEEAQLFDAGGNLRAVYVVP